MLIDQSEPASTEGVVNEGNHDVDDVTADGDDSRSAHRAFACTKSATMTSMHLLMQYNTRAITQDMDLYVMKA